MKSLNKRGDTRGWWLKDQATPEERLVLSSRGGKKISEDRLHMAEIGRKGGNRHSVAHMRKIAQMPRKKK